MVTELHKSPEEVGAFDFPFVIELLQYWADYPPAHLLLRAIAGYDRSKKKDRSNWRKERAREMGDDTYTPEADKKVFGNQVPQSEEERLAMNSFTGARHLDCAPTHIQEAIARVKRGEHLNVPNSGA